MPEEYSPTSRPRRPRGQRRPKARICLKGLPGPLAQLTLQRSAAAELCVKRERQLPVDAQQDRRKQIMQGQPGAVLRVAQGREPQELESPLPHGEGGALTSTFCVGQNTPPGVAQSARAFGWGGRKVAASNPVATTDQPLSDNLAGWGSSSKILSSRN